MNTRYVTKEEVLRVKEMLNQNMDIADLLKKTRRSAPTLQKIADGAYDYLLADEEEDIVDDDRSLIVLQSIDNRQYQMNELLKKITEQIETMNRNISQLAKSAAETVTVCIALNDAVRKLDDPASAQPALIGKEFDQWDEVIRRVKTYGGNQMAAKLGEVRATIDGSVLYLWCQKDVKDYILASATALNLIKQHVNGTIGYSVDVRLKDLPV